ncbi:adhesion G-protein coupled receptor G6-like [Diadema antillarum]|uniref:adhesion G-protein coupled receptor G6-like n=1 Tax=Diadema antillarum TaxID=105358 RepID=UPI003A8C2CFD
MSALNILCFLGSFLSAICLAATILTYVTFRVLRNLPGICLLNTSSGLFLAAVADVSNTWATRNNVICGISGVIKYCAWLGAFTWMALHAQHMLRVFACSRWQPSAAKVDINSRRKTLFWHALIGWGIPFTYTALLLAFQFSKPLQVDLSFGVGAKLNRSSCWINGGDAAFHLSQDPFFILLGFNLIAIVVTMAAIIRTRLATRRASKTDVKTELAANLIILLKLGVAMGATWLPVVFYRLTREQLLLEVHYFLNSYLGVFLFIAFNFTRRVRQLWREKLAQMGCPTSPGGRRLMKSPNASGTGSSQATTSSSLTQLNADRKNVYSVS